MANKYDLNRFFSLAPCPVFNTPLYTFFKILVFFSKGGGFAVCNTCGKSTSDKTAADKAHAIISKTQKALQEIKALENMDNYEAVLDLAENILAEQRGFFHKLHFSKIGILDKAMDACIYLELWGRALGFGLQTMDAYKLYYPRNHPSVGIQLFRIGR